MKRRDNLVHITSFDNWEALCTWASPVEAALYCVKETHEMVTCLRCTGELLACGVSDTWRRAKVR